MGTRKTRGGCPTKHARVTVEEYEGPQTQIEVTEWHNHGGGVSRQNHHIDIPSSPDLPSAIDPEPALECSEPFYLDEDAYFDTPDTQLVDEATPIPMAEGIKVSAVNTVQKNLIGSRKLESAIQVYNGGET